MKPSPGYWNLSTKKMNVGLFYELNKQLKIVKRIGSIRKKKILTISLFQLSIVLFIGTNKGKHLTVTQMLISHVRSLWVGHHLDVDVIHCTSIQAVQFNASKHAAGKKNIEQKMFGKIYTDIFL